MTKSNNKIKLIAIILAVLLVVSAMISIITLINSNKSNHTPKFGGEQIAKYVFDENNEEITDEGYKTNGNIVTQLTSGSVVKGHKYGLYVDFEESMPNEYVRFLLPPDTLVRNYDYITLDMDLMIDVVGTLEIYSLFRDGSGLAQGTQDFGLFLHTDSIQISKRGTPMLTKEHSGKLHLTFVYDFSNDVTTRVNIYLDGKLLGAIDDFSYSYNILEALCFSGYSGDFIINNVEYNGFEVGYKGAISRVFDNTSINLKDCSDSILYKK